MVGLGGSSQQRVLFSLVLLTLVMVVAARLYMGGWSASHFVVHGEVFHHAESNINDIRPVAEGGYDGQFFTRLAFDPLEVRKDAFGITLDLPAYRAQRILYPFFAWSLALGHAQIVPYALVAINVLSLLILYALILRLLTVIAPNSTRLYAVLAVLLPGFLFSLSRNLSEPLGVCLVSAALLALLKRRVATAAVTFALATLVRETFCLTAFAAGIWLFVSEQSVRPLRLRLFNMLAVWASIIPMLAWQGYLFMQLGTIGPLASQGNMAAPFFGLFSQLLVWAGSLNGKAAANLVYLIWHLVVAGFVLAIVLRAKKRLRDLSTEQKLLLIIWVVQSLFITLLSTYVWEDAWAFCRVLSEWSVLSILIIASYRPRLPVWLVAYSSALSVLSLVRVVTRL